MKREISTKAREAVARSSAATRPISTRPVWRAPRSSLSENFSDGVVSPVFWIGLLGLTGGAVYKAVNTADSMLGHRTHRATRASASLRRNSTTSSICRARGLSGLLIVAAAGLTSGASAGDAWRVMVGDAGKHASPNAGYPEAAMAGALGLSLGGPRSYDGKKTDGAWLGDGQRRKAKAADIKGRAQPLGAPMRDRAVVFVLAALTAIV
ncbi:MAG: CobD/CbiB family cobalamin biosynthesis protein [Hyphomicrobiales bacterium]